MEMFPEFMRPFIGLGLSVFLLYSVFEVLKKNFIFLVVLILLLPASVPFIKDGVVMLFEVLHFLFPF
ncbi:MAG: hypothetical protein R3B41_01955 [Candidatus Doudnabacteria bacterium]